VPIIIVFLGVYAAIVVACILLARYAERQQQRGGRGW
jgi:hypothetical protein